MSQSQRIAPFVVALRVACCATALLSGCGDKGAPVGAAPNQERKSTRVARIELSIYAAASTRDALQAIEAAYEADHAVDLVVNFGSSGDLARQIIAAAKADVFLSADEQEMDEVEEADLVAPGTRTDLLSNQLAVIEPAFEPTRFGTPFDPMLLAGDRVKHLSLANVETVPAGRYAKVWLEQIGAWKSVEAKVVPALDVRAAMAAVEAGAAQAGIVYTSDAARSTKVRVAHAIPVADGPKIVYPVAAIAGRPHREESRAFLAHLASPAGRAAFEKFGFAPLKP